MVSQLNTALRLPTRTGIQMVTLVRYSIVTINLDTNYEIEFYGDLPQTDTLNELLLKSSGTTGRSIR
jgi:hypothetical protein